MNQRDSLVAESSSTQAHQVYASITNRLFTGDDVGRNILTGTTATLYHHITANADELMEENGSRDDGIVIYHHLTGKLRAVTNDTTIANHTVVRHMHILHQQVVRANDGCTLTGCSS